MVNKDVHIIYRFVDNKYL